MPTPATHIPPPLVTGIHALADGLRAADVLVDVSRALHADKRRGRARQRSRERQSALRIGRQTREDLMQRVGKTFRKTSLHQRGAADDAQAQRVGSLDDAYRRSSEPVGPS